jgi:hypothetical protein
MQDGDKVDEEAANDGVHVSVELSGSYDAVTNKLVATESSDFLPKRFSRDIQVILETVVRIDGGTRSRITEALSQEMNVEYESELLVELLQVLDAYESVELGGNTWNPGPRLDAETPRK